MQHIDDLLVLEQTEGMAFVSDNLWGTPVTPSAFGGQLVALSLAAAFKTVPENYLARFIDSVDKTKPAIFKVNDQAPGMSSGDGLATQVTGRIGDAC
ncbi:hypothetical protein H4R22_004871 [Coemansia sp. RSA 1290]|nr:hypothetical protein H4R22_004871 [Coemansia sp. RSA 1290]